MKFFILLVLVLAGAYMFPQVYEEVDSPCQALEKKVLRMNVDGGAARSPFANLALSLTGGNLGAEMAADQYPDLPERVACLATYYDFPDDWRP